MTWGTAAAASALSAAREVSKLMTWVHTTGQNLYDTPIRLTFAIRPRAATAYSWKWEGPIGCDNRELRENNTNSAFCKLVVALRKVISRY
jgi:hypothetical protein